ncbi:MAG: hypothetical protein WC352_06230, partial [Candidatus Omnitrophota bacterium]
EVTYAGDLGVLSPEQRRVEGETGYVIPADLTDAQKASFVESVVQRVNWEMAISADRRMPPKMEAVSWARRIQVQAERVLDSIEALRAIGILAASGMTGSYAEGLLSVEESMTWAFWAQQRQLKIYDLVEQFLANWQGDSAALQNADVDFHRGVLRRDQDVLRKTMGRLRQMITDSKVREAVRHEIRSEPPLRDIIAAIETLNDSAGDFLDPYLEGSRAKLARLISQAKNAGYGESERLGRAYDRKLALIKKHLAEFMVEKIGQITTTPGPLSTRKKAIRKAEAKLQELALTIKRAELGDKLLREVRLAYQMKVKAIESAKDRLPKPKQTWVDRGLDFLERLTRTYPGRTKLVATAVVLTVGKVAWDLTAGENALSPETLRMILT